MAHKGSSEAGTSGGSAAGGEKAKAELIAIAGALLNIAVRAPVTTIQEPKCDKPGESDACPIKVDFPEGDQDDQAITSHP